MRPRHVYRLVGSLLVALAGCAGLDGVEGPGKKLTGTDPGRSPTPTAEPTESPTPVPTATPKPTPTPSPTPTLDPRGFERTVEALAGGSSAGLKDGLDTAASFFYPSGVCFDDSNRVYVADTKNNRIRRILNRQVEILAGNGWPLQIFVPSPAPSTTPQPTPTPPSAGAPAGNQDGLALCSAGDCRSAAALLGNPYGIAVEGGGAVVYFSDRSNHRIRKWAGGQISTVAGGTEGSADGATSSAQFSSPAGIVLASGSLFVADAGNNRIRKISPDGTVTTVAGTSGGGGFLDGATASARFNDPRGVALGADGKLYVADTNNHRIRLIDLQTGQVSTFAGSGDFGKDAVGSTEVVISDPLKAKFARPEGVAIDPSGTVFVADTGNSRIRVVLTSGLVVTAAGSSTSEGATNGAGLSARFKKPVGLAADGSGNVYIADTENNQIRVLRPRSN